MKTKPYCYKGYWVRVNCRQWYSDDFGGSFSTRHEFREYIDSRIARGNLKKII